VHLFVHLSICLCVSFFIHSFKAPTADDHAGHDHGENPHPDHDDEKKHKNDNTALIGGVVGGILGAVVLGAIVYMCMKPKSVAKAPAASTGPVRAGAVEQQLTTRQ
jgi:hypothetical protein